MKFLSCAAVAAVVMGSATVSWAQTGHMMDGGMWGGGWMGGYGGFWVPVVLAIVVVGLIAWIVKQRGK